MTAKGLGGLHSRLNAPGRALLQHELLQREKAGVVSSRQLALVTLQHLLLQIYVRRNVHKELGLEVGHVDRVHPPQ